MAESNIELTVQSSATSPVQLPACQKCGRQDETLRLVIYPFVFSIVVMTFRRAFNGLWCKTHRLQNLTIAGLITSIFGWIGIPFGIIYTPIALFQLAKGGIQPADANVQILATLAEEKLKSGDLPGAIRCLEECLKFRDDPEIQKRLNQIRPRYGAESEPVGCLQISLRLIGTLYLGLLIGTGIGIVDYASRYFVSTAIGEDVPFLIAIFGWAPLIAGIFIGGIGLARIVEQTLIRVQSRNLGLAISFAIGASLFVLYGIFEGAVVADNVYSLTHGQFESIGQIIVVGLLTLLAGGFFWMAVVLESVTSFTFFLVIVLIAAVYFLSINTWTASETIRWQKRINPKAGI